MVDDDYLIDDEENEDDEELEDMKEIAEMLGTMFGTEGDMGNIMKSTMVFSDVALTKEAIDMLFQAITIYGLAEPDKALEMLEKLREFILELVIDTLINDLGTDQSEIDNAINQGMKSFLSKLKDREDKEQGIESFFNPDTE